MNLQNYTALFQERIFDIKLFLGYKLYVYVQFFAEFNGRFNNVEKMFRKDIKSWTLQI